MLLLLLLLLLLIVRLLSHFLGSYVTDVLHTAWISNDETAVPYKK